MRYKHEFTKENFEELMTMPYGENGEGGSDYTT